MSAVPAIAVVLPVELVLILSDHLCFVLGRELALRYDQARVVVRPLLDGMFLLAVVLGSVGCASFWVELVAVGMAVVPDH